MKIFLSHAHADKEWGDSLVATMRADGFSIVRVDDLRAGEHWLMSLREKIDAADLVVVVLTKDGLHSPVTMFELGAAKAAHKQILPLLVEGYGIEDLPRGIVGDTFLRVHSPQEAADGVERYISEQLAAA